MVKIRLPRHIYFASIVIKSCLMRITLWGIKWTRKCIILPINIYSSYLLRSVRNNISCANLEQLTNCFIWLTMALCYQRKREFRNLRNYIWLDMNRTKYYVNFVFNFITVTVNYMKLWQQQFQMTTSSTRFEMELLSLARWLI